MKRFFSFMMTAIAVAVFAVNVFAIEEARFMSDPDINGDKIVFTYEDDLWLVNTTGGSASRLTSVPGREFSARFSPDGQSIAFTGEYEGSQDVYVIPAAGGEAKRLTYVPGRAQSICWTPDGEKVVFRSIFENFMMRDPNLYFVRKTGSAPERFPLERGVRCSFSPDGKKILYTRKGAEDYQWKRYKGGDHTDTWMYNFETNTYTPISDYIGKNIYPMWIGGTMAFLSDRDTDIVNIYFQDLETKKIEPKTKYTDFDVMMPATDGKTIIYVYNGYIHLLNVQTGTIQKISVTAPSDQWATRGRYINPKDYIHYATIANDGKKVIIEARGDIFTIPSGKGQTFNITRTPGEREMYPQFSPDGKRVAFFSDKTGEYQLYVQELDSGKTFPLTDKLDRTHYELYWSPDGKKILFGNKDFSIFYVDVETKKLKMIDQSNQLKNDEFTWKISDYNWSPDSRWICYSFVQYNRNSKIFLYNIEKDQKYAVTDDFFDNLNPCFDTDGKYLYYLSSRNFDVQMDFYEDNHVLGNPQQVMAVQLQAGQEPPFIEKDEETVETPAKKDPATGVIDIDGISTRTFVVPVSAGNYFHLKAAKGKILWSSVPKFSEDEYEEIFQPKDKKAKWNLHIFDMKTKKEIVLKEKISNFKVSTNGEQIIIQVEDDWYTQSIESAFEKNELGQKLDLEKMLYKVEPREEWNQIFSDVWRWYRDFFYDKGMHGHDWKAVGDTYRSFIPYVASRQQLNWLMSQMVGELSVGHAYIGGGDEEPNVARESKLFTGLLGADLIPAKENGYYKFARIYGPTVYKLDIKAPLVRPDIELKEGWYLLAINGKEVKAPEDYFKYLQVLPEQKVKLTVNREPTMVGAKTYEVTPVENDRDLRYFRWLTGNIQEVLGATDGKVGYMHINAMNDKGIGEFDKFWRAFRYKDGIIIDMRRNSGGWTEYFFIDKLERKMAAYNNLKEMVPFRYPGSVSNGKFVVITNEYNGSDGEAFVEHFKARKLGTVVGTLSWGGLVGIINAQKTIDNGSVNQPNNAFFGKEGKWWVENHGADPDIVIDNDPASVMAGKDLQLEKAIEVIKEQINNDPFQFPPKPAYPKR
ncbi:MAG TPA: S41 family peptidase [Candidatus Deferrimicrobium sp.]|nr:S41 family peptidase [Candidatus Deferrimicrobium sp.]